MQLFVEGCTYRKADVTVSLSVLYVETGVSVCVCVLSEYEQHVGGSLSVTQSAMEHDVTVSLSVLYVETGVSVCVLSEYEQHVGGSLSVTQSAMEHDTDCSARLSSLDDEHAVDGDDDDSDDDNGADVGGNDSDISDTLSDKHSDAEMHGCAIFLYHNCLCLSVLSVFTLYIAD